MAVHPPCSLSATSRAAKACYRCAWRAMAVLLRCRCAQLVLCFLPNSSSALACLENNPSRQATLSFPQPPDLLSLRAAYLEVET